MYDLPGKDSPNEFIELFNISPSDTIDLSTMEVRDKYATDQLVCRSDSILLPLSYALIMEGDYDLESGIYSTIIPRDAVICFVDDSSIGNGLSASDSLYLVNSTGVIIDSLGWDLDLYPGYSYERLLSPGYSGEPVWSASVDFLGTPGKINSNTPPSLDGAVISVSVHSGNIHKPGKNIAFSVILANSGIDLINGVLRIIENGLECTTSRMFHISPQDSLLINMEIDNLTSGVHDLDFCLSVPGDLNQDNDTVRVNVGVRFKTGSIRISEFLPQPGIYEFEFVEISNCSSDPIDICGWKIADRRTVSPLVPESHVLQPGSYFIFASDSTIFSAVSDTVPVVVYSTGFPGLNNYGDMIKVHDPFGTIIDSLEYDEFWPFAPGFSFEKILPCNQSPWSLAINPDGITPGYYNSVSPRWTDGKIDSGSFIVDPPLPEEGQSFNICINVINAGEGPLDGILACTFNGIHQIETAATIVGYLDTLFICFSYPGMEAGFADVSLSLLVEGDTVRNNNLQQKILIRFPPGSVKINEFLPSPVGGLGEFIEIISERTLSLEGWIFQDRSGTTLHFPRRQLSPGGLFVVAEDSSVIPYIKGASSFFVSPDRWPSLNNEKDEMLLIDPGGVIVESVSYDSSWPIVKGRSLERISIRHASNSSFSWQPSVAPEGLTPGGVNSVYLPDRTHPGFHVALNREIFSPDQDGIDERVEVAYYTPFPSTVLTLQVFNLEGVLVWELFRTFMPGEGLVSWNGMDSRKQKLPIGIYIMKLFLENPAGPENYELVKPVVLARRLK